VHLHVTPRDLTAGLPIEWEVVEMAGEHHVEGEQHVEDLDA
jgi:hypothetical protein